MVGGSERCAVPPPDKKAYVEDISHILVNDYGRQKYYKPTEVERAHQKSKWYDHLDFSCWAMSVFSTHEDFDRHHAETGEICDYTEMKTEMLSGITMDSTDFFSLDHVNMDASWLDLGSVFEGIGNFFSSIDIDIDL